MKHNDPGAYLSSLILDSVMWGLTAPGPALQTQEGSLIVYPNAVVAEVIALWPWFKVFGHRNLIQAAKERGCN